MKNIINTWYLCAIRDESMPFGYKTITPKGKFYPTIVQALLAKKKFEWVYSKVFVLKRTCQPLKY